MESGKTSMKIVKFDQVSRVYTNGNQVFKALDEVGLTAQHPDIY